MDFQTRLAAVLATILGSTYSQAGAVSCLNSVCNGATESPFVTTRPAAPAIANRVFVWTQNDKPAQGQSDTIVGMVSIESGEARFFTAFNDVGQLRNVGAISLPPDIYQVMPLDLDGDSRMDLAVSTKSGLISVYLDACARQTMRQDLGELGTGASLMSVRRFESRSDVLLSYNYCNLEVNSYVIEDKKIQRKSLGLAWQVVPKGTRIDACVIGQSSLDGGAQVFCKASAANEIAVIELSQAGAMRQGGSIFPKKSMLLCEGPYRSSKSEKLPGVFPTYGKPDLEVREIYRDSGGKNPLVLELSIGSGSDRKAVAVTSINEIPCVAIVSQSAQQLRIVSLDGSTAHVQADVSLKFLPRWLSFAQPNAGATALYVLEQSGALHCTRYSSGSWSSLQLVSIEEDSKK